MEYLKITIRAEGEASGMYPVGYVTELLYRAIEWLEANDQPGSDLKARLPLTRQFREGNDGTLSIEVRQETPEEEARKDANARL